MKIRTAAASIFGPPWVGPSTVVARRTPALKVWVHIRARRLAIDKSKNVLSLCRVPTLATSCTRPDDAGRFRAAGTKNCESHEADGWGASAKGAQPRVVARPSPVSRGFKSSSSVTITVLFNARRSRYRRVGLATRRLRMEDGRFVA
jgi:hypothetical protein